MKQLQDFDRTGLESEITKFLSDNNRYLHKSVNDFSRILKFSIIRIGEIMQSEERKHIQSVKVEVKVLNDDCGAYPYLKKIEIFWDKDGEFLTEAVKS